MIKNTVIDRFMEDHKELLELNPKCGLYIHEGTEQTFVIEYDERNGTKDHDFSNKVVVFCYDCGSIYNIKIESGTFGHYLMRIPLSDDSEYLRFR